MNKNEVAISYTFIRKSALIFVALPLMCFFIGWLRWYWVALTCLALLICLILSDENSKFYKAIVLKGNAGKANEVSDSGINEKRIVISRKLLFSIIVISCIYLILCGIGRLWAQSADYPWRNAIFRDLIVRDWPVFYDKYDGALCYYFGVWLPAAIPGKLVYFVSGSQSAAFFAGNIAFLLYFTIGLSILFLLLLLFFNSTNAKSVLTIILGFVFFSGMDILGVILMESYSDFKDLHIEWWSGFQYSSLTTCICWVFNQALIPWICMMLILLEKKLSNFVFIGMACLFCGPFPFIGFLVYCLAIGCKHLVARIQAKEGKLFAKEVFSASNIISAILIFPFIGLFLTSNTFMNNTTAESAVAFISTWDEGFYFLYSIFVLIEFGIVALLITNANKKNYLFYVTVLQLLIYPFIDVGVNSDLSMRASIPSIFVLYTLCYKYILDNSGIWKKQHKADIALFKSKIVYLALVVCLVFGAVTPGIEFLRGITRVCSRGINDYSTDYVISLNRDSHPVSNEEEDWPPTNFVAVNYEDTLFFKYFVRR